MTVEQDTLGGTVAHYPRGKIVMTAPAILPGHGKLDFRETTKEALLQVLTGVVDGSDLDIRFEERVVAIETLERGFLVRTTRVEYRPTTILLSIGRRGTPRALGVPGEEQSKVVYRLIDPEQYRGQRVLVVGGGDSALEAALSVAEESGTSVTLSYRSESFSRAKPKNRKRVEAAEAEGALTVWLESNVIEIGEHEVVVETKGGRKSISNDAVIICAGGVLPTALLRDAGVEIETRHGEA
jgi:thioredoxin reductase